MVLVHDRIAGRLGEVEGIIVEGHEFSESFGSVGRVFEGYHTQKRGSAVSEVILLKRGRQLDLCSRGIGVIADDETQMSGRHYIIPRTL